LAEPQAPLVGEDGTLFTKAVHVPELLPPLIPVHVHDAELPGAGKVGVELTVPAEQKVSEPKPVAV
jgi:hypothetical protein